MNMNTRADRSREGMVLFAVLAVLGGLAMICGTVFIITSTEVKISKSYNDATKAFYNTDAAVNYIRTRINQSLAAGAISLTSNAIEVVSYTAPAGYNFDPVTRLTRLADGESYTFQVTGRESNSVSSIDVTFKRKKAIGFGVFADNALDLKANGNVYSYYSSAILNPTPPDSTGEADVGTNNDVISHVGTFVHGSLMLGEDEFGNPAVWADPGSGSTITGVSGGLIPRVNPDPLGIASGDLAVERVAASSSNNNGTTVPAIPGSREITLNNGDSMTMRSGTYYVDDIVLKNGSTLDIIATNGPVRIFMTGGADFMNGSSVNITGRPTDVYFYSNSSEDITLMNFGELRAFFYAPFAEISINNKANFLGVAWGDEVTLRNDGDVYIDMTLMRRILAKEIQMLTWKEVR